MSSSSQCKVCASFKLKEFKHKKTLYNICNECGFIFLKEYPNLNVYQQRFESDFVENPKEFQLQLIEDYKNQTGNLPSCNSEIKVETH